MNINKPSILATGETSFLDGRILVWFSFGAASACAAKLALAKYGSSRVVEIINCNTTQDEHPDNARFMRDCEQWLGVSVKQIQSPLYSTADEVFQKTRYMSGPDGARCTAELKKKPRIAYQWAEDTHVWGMTADEGKRIRDFEWNNPELLNDWILRDAGMTKDDCHAMISEAGIEQAAMYRLGYKNNNCIGCVKAQSPAYWNKIREDFPAKFAERAARSRELGVRLVKVKGVRVFLDELAPECAEVVFENLSCGAACNPAEGEE